MSVSARVALATARHVDDVFGVMGNGNAWFLDALERFTPVTFTAVRHEAGAVVAADAYFRASGRIAAATATYGAGFTNTLTALAESVRASVPLLLVVGDAPTGGLRPWDVDQEGVTALIGAETFRVGIHDVDETVARAVAHAQTHQVPAVVAIPYDLATAAALDGDGVVSTRQILPLVPDANAVAGLHARLSSAKRPVILAGRGAWVAGAGPALGALADACGALTASTALARGIFPRAEYDLGVTGGFGAEAAMQTVREADVAVVFGASLNQFTMRFGDLFHPDTHVTQIDIKPAATHGRVDDFIRGDAATTAGILARDLKLTGAASTPWREAIDVAPLTRRDVGGGVAADGRLDPRTVASRMAELLPADRVVVSDGGHFIGWANMYWPVTSPDRMMMVGTAFQSIGFGLPSVPGAARAKPESVVVLTTGDGGALMALADLESAVRVAGGRGIAVVWNDSAYGAELNLYGLMGAATPPMLIPQVDFAALADAFGAEGVIVSALADLAHLERWASQPVDSRRFLVLDVRISSSIIAPYQQEIIRVNS
ncbi:MAG: thiamine pyrophosphate-binding protein [Microbacterium sp.]|uniref:thiamine pyrophosphate-binding protein n=1 Tax=Microbacterium sp. TaxID=51671 RepID=UPI003F7F25AD